MDCSTPGFPVFHQVPELTQTHVHGVGDAIQPSHPLSSPSPPAVSLSQHPGLFQWFSGQSIGVSASASFFAHWHFYSFLLKWTPRDFPGGPVVKNLPCNADDMSSIPEQGTKTSHAEKQLSPCDTTRESVCCNERPWRMQWRSLCYT